MNLRLLQRNQTRVANFTLWLSVPSIVFFLLTLSNMSIVEFPAAGLFYFKSLPSYYWIGVSLTLTSVLIPFLLRIQSSSYRVILPLVLLGFYLYGTPILTTEVPRFQDVFIHGAEAVPILSTGFIDPSYNYAREYPHAFIYMTMSVIVQNLESFMFFRIIELFVLLSIIVLVFVIARSFSQKYASIASLALMAVFMTDQGHFSPQGIAIIIYLIFFLSLIKITRVSTGNRRWLISAILALIAINLTSPTNSFFLLLNMLMIVAIGYIWGRKAQRQVHRQITNRVLFFSFICGMIFLSWSVYNAQSHTILKAETFGGEIAEKFGSVEGVKITREPDASYLFVNNVRMLVTVFAITTGIVLSIILMRNNVRFALILVGWFAIAYFIVVSMYASSSLLGRNFMYTAFPWSILVATFLAYKKDNKLHNTIRSVLIISIILFILVVPVTRYGREPTTYVGASLVDATEIIAEKSQDGKVVSYSMGGTALRYFKAVEESDIQVRRYFYFFEKSFEEERVYHVEDWIRWEVALTDDKIIFSEPEKNIITLKYSEGALYDKFEKDISMTHNLIVDNGDTRVYSKRD